jgi:hypothetical protein
MRRKFMRGLQAFVLPHAPSTSVSLDAIHEAELAPLPDSAQRYLRFMGVLGRPRIWSFQVAFTGRFRRSREDAWRKCATWQYNTYLPLTRIFLIRIRFAGIAPVFGWDTYTHGRGRMLIRLLDLVTIGDGIGPEYDIGELVTYLNDGILIAPSMLLVPEVRWSRVDASSFDIALTDHGRTVSARVITDERGAPIDFITTDRFYADPNDPHHLVRAQWTTPVEGWQAIDGRHLPTRGKAIWQMPDGPFAYADFTLVPRTLAFNVSPGE